MWQGDRTTRELRQPSLFGEDERNEWDQPGVPGLGVSVFLASVDHYSKWRIPQCYFPSGEVRHRDDFVSLGESMMRRAAWRGETPIPPELYRPLGSILHELFKNTHEWARTDEEGVPHLRSVRGLLAQGHTWGEQEIADVVEGSPALAAYLRNPDFRTNEGRFRCLELSIFDSGIGLARRWLSRESTSRNGVVRPTLDEEYQACMECFLRWKTSSGALHKGLGLHEVMETLSKLQGFFRVRTGRLSLYRDFVARPYGDSAPATSHILTDWSSQSESPTAMASVQGTLYTMLLPIRNRRP
jgi:hypothetical protein